MLNIRYYLQDICFHAGVSCINPIVPSMSNCRHCSLKFVAFIKWKLIVRIGNIVCITILKPKVFHNGYNGHPWSKFPFAYKTPFNMSSNGEFLRNLHSTNGTGAPTGNCNICLKPNWSNLKRKKPLSQNGYTQSYHVNESPTNKSIWVVYQFLVKQEKIFLFFRNIDLKVVLLKFQHFYFNCSH